MLNPHNRRTPERSQSPGFSQGGSMAAPSRAVFKRRETATAMPLYYSGHIQKKYTGEGGFRTYFGELRGSTLFFYSDEKQESYTERLELYNLMSMAPVASYSNRTAPVYTLKFPNEEVQLKVDNPDSGELWKGYILTVAKLEVPQELQLLPGQFMNLEEVKDRENERRIALVQAKARPPTPDTDQEYDDMSSLPTCYMEVSRDDAEELLAKNPDNGSIILRPATNKKNFSATTRQVFPSGAVIKNYKIVSCFDGGFTIELDKPVTVPTLNDVVQYFVKETSNQLRPFMPRAYDTRIEVVPPIAPKPKVVPKARVAPTIHTLPPTRPLPPPPLLQKQESAYENEDVPHRKTDPHAEKKDKKKKNFKPASLV